MGVQLLIGVNFVTVFLGKLMRHAQRFAEGDQKNAECR